MDQHMDLTFNYGQTNRHLEKNPILEVLADLKISKSHRKELIMEYG